MLGVFVSIDSIRRRPTTSTFSSDIPRSISRKGAAFRSTRYSDSPAASSHGCVSAHSVDEVTSPPQSASEIVFLTDRIALPPDHTQVVESGGCIVYSGSTLTRASGFKFARAKGTAQSGSTPAHAQISLTNSGSC